MAIYSFIIPGQAAIRRRIFCSRAFDVQQYNLCMLSVLVRQLKLKIVQSPPTFLDFPPARTRFCMLLPARRLRVHGLIRCIAKKPNQAQFPRRQTTAAIARDDEDHSDHAVAASTVSTDETYSTSDSVNNQSIELPKNRGFQEAAPPSDEPEWKSANIDHESLIAHVSRAAANQQTQPRSTPENQDFLPPFIVAFSIFDDLLLNGKFPSKKTLSALLALACQANNDIRITQIQELCQERWIQLPTDSLELVAQHYCDTNAPEQCKEFLMKKQAQGYNIPAKAWSALVSVLIKLGETAEVLQTFQEVEQIKNNQVLVSFSPSLYYDALICFADKMDVTGLQWIWTRMDQAGLVREVDAGTCTKILNVCGRAGLPVLATDIFKYFAGRGISPSSYHYAALIESYCKAGDVKNAFNILEIMRNEDVERTTTTASGILAFMASDIEQIDRAFSTLQDLKAEGHDIDISALNVIIDASVLRRDLSRAVATYQEYLRLGVQPDINTLNGLLAGCVGAFKKDLALSLIKLFRDDHGVKADTRTFSSLISVCVLEDDYEDAFRYLEEMKEEGHQPPVEVYSLIIRRCVSRGDPRAQVALHEMKGWGYRDHFVERLLDDNSTARMPAINEVATGVFDKMRSMAESYRYFLPK